MKKLSLLIVLLMAASVSVFAQKNEVKVNESVVKWTGTKIGGSHYGEIELESGYFEFKNEQIVGGEVVMDMNSITVTDIEDAGYNQKLVGHLKSDDFFGVEKFSKSKFVVSKATKFSNGSAKVSGELTIKGKTESLSFDVKKDGDRYTAQLKVDRSKYDVRYGSNSFFDNLGDKAIGDIFTLDITLRM
ncbi:YceI family protein [Marinifilum caeruleilacunae]|uniref:YceI family protein n=1 Tax=Marinifilum caeruleilacunae TaxID=2499076 RepID=A0ABX1WSH8_9BACT|nr:YceI family protein [Marinifilum caeruleilacunae]NOU59027.1 YceI family protein [Marinifilum caeruleilacunae]